MVLNKKRIVIIGGGAAGIMTALQLSSDFDIYLVEKEKNIGRKLLVAGKGGFNLTNNAVQDSLIDSYTPLGFLDDALNCFTASQLRSFLKEIEIETFVGSSNRVFPLEGIKPIEVLNAFTKKLNEKKVTILLNHSLLDFSEEKVLLLNTDNEKRELNFDFCILAMGGASWKKTGSDGSWITLFQKKNKVTVPFQASNCGVNINWSSDFIKNHQGKPLKNIRLSINNLSIKGEALVTHYGLEGNAIYPLIKEVRNCFRKGLKPILKIDFKPKNSLKSILTKINTTSPKEYANRLNLNSVEMALLKNYTTKETYLDYKLFSKKIKELRITIDSLRSIEEAISTVGGIPIDSLNNDFSLKQAPHIYTIGEMVDWDAPTGGYLLQACFSMGYKVAQSIHIKIVKLSS